MLRRHVSPHDKGAKHSEARTTTHHILLSEDIKKIDEQESSDLSPFRIVLSDRKALAIHREHNVSCAARSSVKGLPAPPRNSECRARSARAKQLCSEAAQGGRSWRCPGGAGDPQRRRRRVVDNIKWSSLRCGPRFASDHPLSTKLLKAQGTPPASILPLQGAGRASPIKAGPWSSGPSRSLIFRKCSPTFYCPFRLEVRTPHFQGGNAGSIPARDSPALA